MAVKLTTNLGFFFIEQDAENAQKNVENILNKVKSCHNDVTIFHRVIDGCMIQGGGFEPGMKQIPTNDPIENEAKNGLKNEPFTLAMARTSEPHSASAQYFINVKNNSFLDYPGQDGWGYCVFGKVVEGTDVVDKIKAVPTGGGDVPMTPIVIESATLMK